MSLGIWVLSLLLSLSTADFSPSSEAALKLKTAQIYKARLALEERVRAFNSEELLLKKIISPAPGEFESAVSALNVSAEERQTLREWNAVHDSKRLSTYARKRLLETFERLAFQRSEWENFFPSSHPAGFAADVASEHQRIIAARRAQAVVDSRKVGISLHQLKTNAQTLSNFCAEIPKGAILHTHPYGTMDRATVEYVLETFNPLIEKATLLKYIDGTTEKIHPQEVQFVNLRAEYYSQARSYLEIRADFPQDAQSIVDLFFVPRDSHIFTQGVTPFSRFLAAFALPLEILGILTCNTAQQIALEQIIYDHLFLRGLAQRVHYMEITRNLPVLKNSRLFIDRYNELLVWTGSSHAVKPRTLLSFNRTSLDSSERRLQQVATMSQLLSMESSPYVVGINLMGDESLVDALDAAQFVYGKLLVENKVRTTGLSATIHAGELGDVRNLRDALVFDVRRIGHGILLQKDPVVLELVRRQGVALEISLTSNEILQVSPLTKNPFLSFHRLGIPVSLSTDDEGMFQTDPNQECVRAIANSDMEYTELRQMMIHSVTTSFADNALKSQLLKDLEADFASFEMRWKNVFE